MSLLTMSLIKMMKHMDSLDVSYHWNYIYWFIIK